jgi:hypothetical protein
VHLTVCKTSQHHIEKIFPLIYVQFSSRGLIRGLLFRLNNFSLSAVPAEKLYFFFNTYFFHSFPAYMNFVGIFQKKNLHCGGVLEKKL